MAMTSSDSSVSFSGSSPAMVSVSPLPVMEAMDESDEASEATSQGRSSVRAVTSSTTARTWASVVTLSSISR